MKNYQSLHYRDFYLMNDDGTTVPCDRRTCFAPPEERPDCPYPQRWFYDPEAAYAVRLARTEQGDAIGRRCMADLKKAERVLAHSAGQVSMDAPRAGKDGDDMGGLEIPDATDIEQLIADADTLHRLLLILEQLTEDDLALVRMLVSHAKKADIAAHFHITVDGVRYRELQMRKRLRKNAAFQNLFGNS